MPPEPHAEPVEERSPDAFACTQEVAELPRPETMRLVVEARPTLSTENSVVVAEDVLEPIGNNAVLVEPLFAWTDSVPHGVVEAMPIAPVVGSWNAVEVAGSVP